MKNYHENTAKYRVTRKQAESLIWNMLSISELTDVRLKRKWDKIYELDKYSRAA
jgi:very-short-patch-repair endonuclease